MLVVVMWSGGKSAAGILRSPAAHAKEAMVTR